MFGFSKPDPTTAFSVAYREATIDGKACDAFLTAHGYRHVRDIPGLHIWEH